MYAALKIGIEDKPESLRRWDIPVLAAAIVFSFIPMAFAAKLGLLLTGGYLFAASTRGSAERRIALLLLALTGPLIWGRLILVAFAAPILALDARLVGSAIGSNVDGNLVQFAGGSKIFVIGNGCSSLHNMSLAIVLWTTAAVLFEIRIDRRYVAIGGAMVAWMFLLNIARLASIGLFPKDFDLLHVGAGAALFGWAGLIGAALLAGLGVASAVRRQR
jgi:exosortase/archaeosortase family protein